jgi:hypothetical protein
MRTFTALLTILLALSIVGTAQAATTRCHRQGKAVSLSQAPSKPDAVAYLLAGQTATVSFKGAFSDFHAYAQGGGQSIAYRCRAGKRGSRWTEYRRARSGRILASFDGETFTAYAPVITAAWKG